MSKAAERSTIVTPTIRCFSSSSATAHTFEGELLLCCGAGNHHGRYYWADHWIPHILPAYTLPFQNFYWKWVEEQLVCSFCFVGGHLFSSEVLLLKVSKDGEMGMLAICVKAGKMSFATSFIIQISMKSIPVGLVLLRSVIIFNISSWLTGLSENLHCLFWKTSLSFANGAASVSGIFC